MVAVTANRGVFHTNKKKNFHSNFKLREMREVLLSKDLPYHWFYLLICFLGFVGHDFLFCILVSVSVGVSYFPTFYYCCHDYYYGLDLL